MEFISDKFIIVSSGTKMKESGEVPFGTSHVHGRKKSILDGLFAVNNPVTRLQSCHDLDSHVAPEFQRL